MAAGAGTVPSMKMCTKARVLRSHADENGGRVIDDMEIIDLSLVPDDHEAGFDPEGLLHIQAPSGSLTFTPGNS